MTGRLDILAARASLYRRGGASRTYLDYMHSAGLSLPTLAAYDYISGFCGCLVVTHIAAVGGGMFDFAEPDDPDAFDGAVIEAFDRDGETTIDLVAWPLDRPERVLSMFRRAPLLGLWQAMSPYQYTFDRPIDLHRTPEDWLKANCDGCAIVVPALAPYALLNLPGRFAARDRAHAQEIDAMLHGAVADRMMLPRAA